MIKLVVSDLDGTLLPRGEEKVDSETITTIKKIQGLGIYFAIASGRSYKELSNFMKEVKHSIFLISENGALITYRGKILKKIAIEKNKAIKLINEIDKQGYDCLISGVYTLYTTSKNQAYINYLNKIKKNVMKINKVEELPEVPLRVSVHIGNGKKVNRKWVVETMENLNIAYYGEEWIDIMEKGVHKGIAVQQIKKCFFNKDDEIMAFGDQKNDREMVIIADYSYAMSNGDDEIINICNKTTDDPIKTIKKHIGIS